MGSLFALSGVTASAVSLAFRKQAEGRFQESMKPDLSNAFVTM
jgi:hypothetical protein